MFTLRAVEHLDVVEHILLRFVAGFVGSAPYSFPLEQVEEAFGNGVIVAVTAAAHGMFQVVGFQERRRIYARELLKQYSANRCKSERLALLTSL